jgi:predicted phage terminase large subunit-like protein
VLLTDEEIDRLDAEAAVQYGELVADTERYLDLVQVAKGLTMDLAEFERSAWNVLEPDTVLSWSWHYEYLCEWLTLISSGAFKQQFPDKLGLIITVPPRTGKSLFTTVNWPVWTWLSYPSRRFLFGSHSNSLAVEHGVKRRQLINSLWFQERFGDRFGLITDAVTMVRNDHTGQFFVTSIGAKQTGFGGDICVGDDLLDRADAWSASQKKTTNSWLDSSFSKMLNQAATGVFVHISQRLAVDDPAGHLLGEDGSTGKPDQWVRIKIQREAIENEEYVYPISGTVHARPKGDILDAQRCTPIVLGTLKAKSREWANQEQQEPTPQTGSILNPNWMRWYQASTDLPTFFQVIVSVDCAFKSAQDNDLVAIHKYAMMPGARRYMLDRRTELLGYVATKQAVKEMARGGHTVPWLKCPMPPATQCLIENKANGPAITEELRADPKFGISVIEYNPIGSKDQRFYAATGDAEGGLCYWPEDAPWIGALRKQLTDFAGEGSIPHDDDCDAWSQFVNWSRQHQYGLLGYLEKKSMEQSASLEDPSRCLFVDEQGKERILEWDALSGYWVDRQTGDRFAPAPTEDKPNGRDVA